MNFPLPIYIWPIPRLLNQEHGARAHGKYGIQSAGDSVPHKVAREGSRLLKAAKANRPAPFPATGSFFCRGVPRAPQQHGSGAAFGQMAAHARQQGGGLYAARMAQEAVNRQNIDWQGKIHRGILQGLRNISETP